MGPLLRSLQSAASQVSASSHAALKDRRRSTLMARQPGDRDLDTAASPSTTTLNKGTSCLAFNRTA